MNLNKIFTCSILIFLLASPLHAEKWKTIIFNEDISQGLDELDKYCLLHDIKSEDVMWFNNLKPENLKAGQKIYLPKNQADMLAIWQIQSKKNNSEKSAKLKQTKKIKSEITSEPVKKSQPDKILSSSNDLSNEQKISEHHVHDPVIVFSPNGDISKGPTRLAIFGNKIEAVELPKTENQNFDEAYIPFGNAKNFINKYIPAPNKNKNVKKPGNQKIIQPKISSYGMLWPVDGKVSSPFGSRGGRKHEGIDIPMPAGTPISAAKSGTVERTGNNSTIGFRGYGNFILINHGGGFKTFYSHCQKVNVKAGQKVLQGEIIGTVGSTGRATANHLHFEIRVNDVKVNPVPYLSGNTRMANK